MPAAPPSVVALLTCASIYQDEVSGKASLLGVCNGFEGPNFPAQLPRLVVYLSLTDGHGPTAITVRLVSGDEEHPAFTSQPLEARFTSPLQVREFAVETPAITLPAPGLYRWQVVCEGVVIHERKFPVVHTAG
jgi:hypothetical protein